MSFPRDARWFHFCSFIKKLHIKFRPRSALLVFRLSRIARESKHLFLNSLMVQWNSIERSEHVQLQILGHGAAGKYAPAAFLARRTYFVAYLANRFFVKSGRLSSQRSVKLRT